MCQAPPLLNPTPPVLLLSLPPSLLVMSSLVLAGWLPTPGGHALLVVAKVLKLVTRLVSPTTVVLSPPPSA